MSENTGKIVRNALFGFSTWVLPMLISFVATPIIVSSLGHEDYGIYALVLGFISYSFNFGIGRAITKYIAEYRADEKPELVTKLISATFTLNLIIGIAGAAIIVFSANWLVDNVFLIEAPLRVNTVYAFYLSAMIIFMSMMNQVGSSILQGIHRFDVYSKLFNANSIAIIIGNVILAMSGFSLLWLLSWNLFSLSVSTVLGIVVAKRLAPEFKLRLEFSKAAILKTMGFSIWIVGYQILGNALLLFERGWIIRKLGPESLTFYVVPMTIGVYIHSSIASLMLVLFPLASEHAGDKSKLLRLYQKATKITCLLVFFMVMSLVIQSRQFLTLWMGPEFALQASDLLILHSITFGIAGILIIAWQMADGLGYPGYNFFVFGFCVLIAVTGMVLLVTDYGNTGVAISRFAGFGALGLSIFVSEKLFFGKVQVGFWAKILFALIPATICGALTEWLVVSNLELSWLILILSTGLGGLVYCGILFLLKFISDDEKELFRRVIKV